jgi:lipopolysaccharide transport system permease protein
MTTLQTLPATSPAAGRPPVSPARKKPYLTVRARSGWAGVDLRELWRFRDLLLSLTARDIKLRYKQTALGVIWVVLQPLVAAGIFAFVFGKLANLPLPQTASGRPIPYFLYAFAGMVAWGLFFNTVTKVSAILVGNSSLVSKVYFPRLLLPLSGATGVLVDLAVSAAMLLVMQAVAGGAGGLTPLWLLSPVFLGLILALSLGLGLWAAAMCVEYRDVAYILPVFLQFLLYASPVGYSGKVGSAYGDFYYLNPLAGLLDAWRWSVLSTPFPPAWAFWYAVAMAVGGLVVGALVFRRMERNFADVI